MAGERTPARMARLVARWRESGESRSSFAQRTLPDQPWPWVGGYLRLWDGASFGEVVK